MFKKYGFNKFGFAALLALFTVIGLVLIITFSVSAVILNRTQTSKNLVFSAQSYYSAESGVEDAVLRKLKNYDLPSGVLNLDGASVTQTIATIGNITTVDSSASYSNNVRKTRVRLIITADSVSFHYGVQVGAGGLEMGNNSTVNGNIYSNGSIIGSSGTKITGDAYAAGANKIEDVIVGGDAHAHEIKTSKICGNAYYQTIDANSLNFLNSPTLPTCNNPLTNGTAHPGSPDPAVVAMPISASNISDWKTDALAGGVYSDAAHCRPAADTVLGPAKLACDFTPGSGVKITLNGTVWVEGDITLTNNVVMQLASVYGGLSGVMIADTPGSESVGGKIIASNNVTICGSSGYNSGTGDCNASNGSYFLILSTHSGTFTKAINISNNVKGGLFYASSGSIDVSNNAQVKEVTGYKLELENNAQVIYESGLASAAFSSGPGAGWKIDSWNETQ